MLLVGGLSLGAGGWWVATLITRQQQTTRQLQQTSSTLSQAQEQLTLLEGERHKLADAYDILKDRWAKSDEELKRLQKSSEEMTAELERRSHERSELQHQLEEATRTVEHRVQTLTQQATSDRTALEAKLSEATQASHELEATLEQMQRRLQQRSREREQLGQHLTELSSVYEGLAPAPPHPLPGAASMAPPNGRRSKPDARRASQPAMAVVPTRVSAFALSAAAETLDPATIPRSSWKLFWNWLLHPMSPSRLDETRRGQAYLN